MEIIYNGNHISVIKNDNSYILHVLNGNMIAKEIKLLKEELLDAIDNELSVIEKEINSRLNQMKKKSSYTIDRSDYDAVAELLK